MSDGKATTSRRKNVLALLTLAKHQHGVWIERLVAALQQKISMETPTNMNINKSQADRIERIQVVVLEDYLKGPFCVSEPSDDPNDPYDSHHGWCGIVNRVSDAAEPWQVKACLAVLHLARQVWKIPIWNGPDAYSLCTNKWCHHVLFQQANLASPVTAVVGMTAVEDKDNNDESTGASRKNQDAAVSLETEAVAMLHNSIAEKNPQDETNRTLEYLVKPNAGGFGAGIERRQASASGGSSPKLSSSSSSILQAENNYSDRMVLFQEYIPPRKGRIYRVWFLAGKVQCAVERITDTIISEKQQLNQQPSTDTEFTSSCMGGVCARPTKRKAKIITEDGTVLGTAPPSPATTFQPWQVPDTVRREIEEQLIPALPADAHCGSVEFLYSDNSSNLSGDHRGNDTRLYFDLNLLSTLPITNSLTVSMDPSAPPSNVPPRNHQDPWMELASSIWRFVHHTYTTCESKIALL